MYLVVSKYLSTYEKKVTLAVSSGEVYANREEAQRRADHLNCEELTGEIAKAGVYGRYPSIYEADRAVHKWYVMTAGQRETDEELTAEQNAQEKAQMKHYMEGLYNYYGEEMPQ